MANEIALTEAKIAAVFPRQAEIYDLVAGVAIAKGEAVYIDSNGHAGVADANAAGYQQFRGIALNAAGIGQAVSVLKRGHIYGFTVSGMAYDAVAYLSDTAGDLSTAVGTMTVNCGRVVPLSDNDHTKVLYVEADWLRTWA